MRFVNHVSVVWDVCAFIDAGTVQPAIHNHLIATPAVVLMKPMSLSIEIPTVVAWPQGMAVGSVKTTSTVYHNHVWIAHKDTDCGPGIMHVSVDPPTDLLMPAHILGSSRTAKFGAGEVKAEGTPIGCLTMLDPESLPTPMLVCGDIPSPTNGTGSAILGNSLLVGMHLADLVMGWIEVFGAMVLGTIQGIAAGGVIRPESGNFGLLGVQAPDLNVASPIVGLLFQEYGGYAGDVSYSYAPITGHLGELKFEVTRAGDSGDVSYDVSSRAGPEAANVRGHLRYTERADGTSEHSATGGVGSYGAGADHDGGGLSTSGWSSPVSEGTSWEDLPLL